MMKIYWVKYSMTWGNFAQFGCVEAHIPRYGRSENQILVCICCELFQGYFIFVLPLCFSPVIVF